MGPLYPSYSRSLTPMYTHTRARDFVTLFWLLLVCLLANVQTVIRWPICLSDCANVFENMCLMMIHAVGAYRTHKRTHKRALFHQNDARIHKQINKKFLA